MAELAGRAGWLADQDRFPLLSLPDSVLDSILSKCEKEPAWVGAHAARYQFPACLPLLVTKARARGEWNDPSQPFSWLLVRAGRLPCIRRMVGASLSSLACPSSEELVRLLPYLSNLRCLTLTVRPGDLAGGCFLVLGGGGSNGCGTPLADALCQLESLCDLGLRVVRGCSRQLHDISPLGSVTQLQSLTLDGVETPQVKQSLQRKVQRQRRKLATWMQVLRPVVQLKRLRSLDVRVAEWRTLDWPRLPGSLTGLRLCLPACPWQCQGIRFNNPFAGLVRLQLDAAWSPRASLLGLSSCETLEDLEINMGGMQVWRRHHPATHEPNPADQARAAGPGEGPPSPGDRQRADHADQIGILGCELH